MYSIMEYKTTATSNISVNLQELLHDFCHIEKNNEIIIIHDYFKKIKHYTSENNILNYLIYVIDTVLKRHETFVANIFIENLTLLEIDKNKTFIQSMCYILRERFPDKLEVCYIHNAPYIFTQLYSFLKLIVDKKTLEKIKLKE